jgi:hypothetical protein
MALWLNQVCDTFISAASGSQGWHTPHDLKPSSGLRVRWPEFFQQYCQGFTQLEPVAGGVCEEESALSNKASILDSSSASRLFSAFSSFKRFSLSSDSILSCYGFAGLRLRSLLDVVDGPPIQHRQKAPPRRQRGDPLRSAQRSGGCRSG